MFGVINKGAKQSFRCGINRRSFVTQVPTDSEFHNARPYSEIPGPTFFQGVRSILPGGKFYKMEPYQVKASLKKEYGNILKLPGHFGRKDIIMSYDPKDFETVFRTEGSLPYRRPLLAVNFYRNNRPDAFVNKGLLNDQGEIWGQMRTVANPIMLKPKTVKNSIPAVDEVAMDFVAKIKAIADDKHEMPANFGVELGKWAFESIGVVALEHRLGVLTNEDDAESNKLIKSVRYLLHLGFQAEALPPIWMQTPIFSVLISSAYAITDILKRYVDSAVDRMAKRQTTGEEDGHESILEKLVKANPDTAIVIAMDMLLAGIDTTTATISGLLYQLAKHPAKQEKLREEVMKILPNVDSKLTATSLNSTPYMRACIKESMRFSPPIPINMRAAGRNLVLQGYQIPKNTDVAMVGSIVQMDENHFSRSSEFLPERWLNGNDVMEGCPNNGRSDNAFTFLPFGFGARACIGKRIAEMELAVVVFRILREFKIEWHYGPLTYSQAFVVAPTNKLKFRMVPLK